MKMNIKEFSIKDFNPQTTKNFNTAKRHLKTLFIISAGIVVLASIVLIMTLESVLTRMHVAEESEIRSSWVWISIAIALSTLIVGSLFSFLAGKIVLQPIDALLDGMAKLSSGDYKARIELFENARMREVADGFNSLASELEHTELVRSDFINNFSHEFKTPLSSMKGLIVLLKSGRVPKAKEREYLEIIEDEADRLTMMTTNILNLSKIQNQKIVVDKERYNLSEQLRGALVIFEKRWSEKGLSISFNASDEEEIVATEELMRQVWINLIDNAVKFAREGSEIGISLTRDGSMVSVSITNEGDEIPETERERIFHKFYQCDTSHARSGNGIGLSIVKSVVEMHFGEAFVDCHDGKTTFTVSMPRGLTD